MNHVKQHHSLGRRSLEERHWPFRGLLHPLRTPEPAPITGPATWADGWAVYWLVLRVIFGLSWMQAALAQTR